MHKLTSHTVKVVLLISSIIIIIVLAGIFSTHTLASSSEKLEAGIEKIESNTKTNNWTKVTEELNKIKKDWSGMEVIWSVLLDHIEIDNIDTSISRVSTFIDSKDKTQTLAEIAVLKQYIKHIPNKESYNLKNIF